MKKIIAVILLVMIMIIVPGCNISNEKVDIYASIYPVYFLADYIADDHLVVKQVYPNGADVHEYDPGNGRDILKMRNAKLMFYIGAGLEAFIYKSQSIFENQPIELVELSDYVKLCKQTSDGFAYLTEEELKNNKTIADTHIWLDPLRMVSMAEIISEKIISIDPDNEEIYKENTEKLILELRALDSEYSTKLGDLSLRKIILVDHDSYLYWEERYGVQRIRTRSNSESCEASPSNINNIISYAQSCNIKHIVTTENETVCGIIDKYAEILGAEVIKINHISTLYKKEIKEGKDYFSIMRSNLDKLVSILPKK